MRFVDLSFGSIRIDSNSIGIPLRSLTRNTSARVRRAGSRLPPSVQRRQTDTHDLGRTVSLCFVRPCDDTNRDFHDVDPA
jgi:hypothetical protein